MEQQTNQAYNPNQDIRENRRFLRRGIFRRAACHFYVASLGLLLFSSGHSQAEGLSILGGSADYNLDFVKRIVKEEVPFHEAEAEKRFTTELLSILNANGSKSVTLMNAVQKDGSTGLETIAKAIRKSGENLDRIFLNTVGSFSNSNNKICRMMFEETEVAFVGPSGNEGIDLNMDLPKLSYCRAPNVLLVSALNEEQDGVAGFSNFGNQLIGIAAQGVKIPAIGPGGKLSFRSGTSPAAAIVAARLDVFSKSHPELQGGGLIDTFLQSAEVLEDEVLKDQVEFGRRLQYGIF